MSISSRQSVWTIGRILSFLRIQPIYDFPDFPENGHSNNRGNPENPEFTLVNSRVSIVLLKDGLVLQVTEISENDKEN